MMKKLFPAAVLLLVILSCKYGNDNTTPSDTCFAPDVEKGISCSCETLRLGSTEAKLFYNEDNYAALSSFEAERLSTAEIFNRYADTFTDVKYAGYHNK